MTRATKKDLISVITVFILGCLTLAIVTLGFAHAYHTIEPKEHTYTDVFKPNVKITFKTGNDDYAIYGNRKGGFIVEHCYGDTCDTDFDTYHLTSYSKNKYATFNNGIYKITITYGSHGTFLHATKYLINSPIKN